MSSPFLGSIGPLDLQPTWSSPGLNLLPPLYSWPHLFPHPPTLCSPSGSRWCSGLPALSHLQRHCNWLGHEHGQDSQGVIKTVFATTPKNSNYLAWHQPAKLLDMDTLAANFPHFLFSSDLHDVCITLDEELTFAPYTRSLSRVCYYLMCQLCTVAR